MSALNISEVLVIYLEDGELHPCKDVFRVWVKESDGKEFFIQFLNKKTNALK